MIDGYLCLVTVVVVSDYCSFKSYVNNESGGGVSMKILKNQLTIHRPLPSGQRSSVNNRRKLISAFSLVIIFYLILFFTDCCSSRNVIAVLNRSLVSRSMDMKVSDLYIYIWSIIIP